MSKRSEIRIALERFLQGTEGKAAAPIVRDPRRRAVLIPEAMIDLDRIGKSGRPLFELGRRITLVKNGPGKEESSSWIIPTELCQISREDPAAVQGLALPFGTVIHDSGLWLRYAPGYYEMGVNDRGDVLVGYDPEAARDPSLGPVRNAFNTEIHGAVERLVARNDLREHEADREEAEAWLRSFAAAGSGKILKVDFKCAGVEGTHTGNVPHLHRTAKLNFFDVRDSGMLRIASILGLRFRKLRRSVPRISVISLIGVPADPPAYAALLKKLKALKKDPVKLGLPARLVDSRFYDAASKAIVPSSFVFLPPSSKLPGDVTVITVNTDYHGEVKNHAVMSALTAIMALIDVIAIHASVAVLNKSGTATMFTGGTGVGKSTAGLFWAEKNEKFRRTELRRRYEVDLRATPDAGRLGELGIQKELDKVMARTGLLCQEDWVGVFKEGAGHWLFWPTERTLYARTGGFFGLQSILGQNQPLLENVAADFGGSGMPLQLGRTNHACLTERVFYDPEWNHLHYDPSPRMIMANVFLERRGETDVLVRRLAPREAIDWLIQGRTLDGGFEPLYNPYPDFSGILLRRGIVGDKLVAAYESAKQGDFGPLGGGDAKLGESLFDRLDIQVKLWMDNCREVPTFLVNGGAGLELTQDVHWLLSEHPEAFDGWKHVGLEEFRKYMRDRYGVTYGPAGEWSHLPPSLRQL